MLIKVGYKLYSMICGLGKVFDITDGIDVMLKLRNSIKMAKLTHKMKIKSYRILIMTMVVAWSVHLTSLLGILLCCFYNLNTDYRLLMVAPSIILLGITVISSYIIRHDIIQMKEHNGRDNHR